MRKLFKISIAYNETRLIDFRNLNINNLPSGRGEDYIIVNGFIRVDNEIYQEAISNNYDNQDEKSLAKAQQFFDGFCVDSGSGKLEKLVGSFAVSELLDYNPYAMNLQKYSTNKNGLTRIVRCKINDGYPGIGQYGNIDYLDNPHVDSIADIIIKEVTDINKIQEAENFLNESEENFGEMNRIQKRQLEKQKDNDLYFKNNAEVINKEISLYNIRLDEKEYELE